MSGIPRSTPLANLDQVIRLREGIFLVSLTEVAQAAASSHRLRCPRTIDQVNRINQFTYNSQGNITEEILPDLTKDQYTYNSYSEPLSHTDPNSDFTSYDI